MTAEAETTRISASIPTYLAQTRRRGVVVALSGGIDSSVVAALCVAAVGKERVFGLHMPERESSPDTLELSRLVADSLGIDSLVEEITPILDAAGCYTRRDDAIRLVCPEYGPGHRSKIVLPGVIDSDSFRLYSVVVLRTGRHRDEAPATQEAYLGIVAATNFKQRVRKMLEYYHADRLNYVVAGTPNRLEYDQGFFVKLGDGAADVKPIAHLYKSQVYALAEHLGVPAEIRSRPLHDRHLLAAAVAGGVLLLAALRADGPVPVRQEQRRPGPGGRRRDGADGRPGAGASTGTSTRSGVRRRTCTGRPSSRVPSPRSRATSADAGTDASYRPINASMATATAAATRKSTRGSGTRTV